MQTDKHDEWEIKQSYRQPHRKSEGHWQSNAENQALMHNAHTVVACWQMSLCMARSKQNLLQKRRLIRSYWLWMYVELMRRRNRAPLDCRWLESQRMAHTLEYNGFNVGFTFVVTENSLPRQFIGSSRVSLTSDL